MIASPDASFLQARSGEVCRDILWGLIQMTEMPVSDWGNIESCSCLQYSFYNVRYDAFVWSHFIVDKMPDMNDPVFVL